MIRQVWKFTRFEEFYSCYQPLTPYGHREKQQRKIYQSEKELQFLFDAQKELLPLIKSKAPLLAQVEFHLKRISLLPSLLSVSYMVTEIFLFKKFLVNYLRIVKLLPEPIRKSFQLDFSSEELLALLQTGQQNEEFFELSRDYDPELKQVRAEICEQDGTIKEERKKNLELIKERDQFDFRFRDFLVIPEDIALALNKSQYYIEPYDQSHFVIKPIYSDLYYKLIHQREQLISREQEIEQNILTSLCARIGQEADILRKYEENLCFFDVSLARAYLADKWDMTEPCIHDDQAGFHVKQGAFLPLKNLCDEKEVTYWPLSQDFDGQVHVIHGSNMGGKTVVLQTIGFLQLLTQMGFFVPAQSFSTSLFEQICYIGPAQDDEIQGLSSFGKEIYQFNAIEENNQRKRLILIDEFARTTNSLEASALLSGLLVYYSEIPQAHVFCSTHFMDLKVSENIKFFRMKGLNKEEYEHYYQAQKSRDIFDRIQFIHRFMEYDIEPESGLVPALDGIRVARLLGMNSNILDVAQSYLGVNDEK